MNSIYKFTKYVLFGIIYLPLCLTVGLWMWIRHPIKTFRYALNGDKK